MLEESLIKKYLKCIKCNSHLTKRGLNLICSKCKESYPIIGSGIPSILLDSTEDIKLSMKKWNSLYKSKKYTKQVENEYDVDMYNQTLKDLQLEIKNKKPGVFLELGSGTGVVGEYFAKKGWFFIGVDFSPASLISLEKRLYKNGIKNFLLIHADIKHLPVLDNTIDFIFGGGVIEHFKDTQIVIDSLYKILRSKGISYNSLPHLNIANIIYRSQWGGIPKIPIFQQIAEFIHMKLLKSKHMVFGYELQFTKKQLKDLHKKVGFNDKNIFITKVPTEIQLNIIKNKWLKTKLKNFIESREGLWPSVKVVAKK
jgi:ubiquinone/menaquinone biosynthesis C-methylase UbiE/uncharacterized protein YbaR (Trm112 family)